MRTLSNSICAIFLLAVLLFIPRPTLSQQTSDYKYSPPAKLNDGIPIGTLRSAKLDEAKVSAGMNAVLKRTYGNIHSVLIFRNGKLVGEEYFMGPDESNHKGEIGVVAHDRETLHDTRSISKSVVALAVLIAHSQGKIKDLNQPVFSFFPEYATHAQGEKKNITVRHALTMTAGLEWNEGISFTDPANSSAQMNRAGNIIEFVLSRKLANKPGAVFEYNGGMTQLLAAIIKKTTGSDIETFARRHLFDPLGITRSEWAKLKGKPDADSGLRLRSRDIAKIGLLIMNGGKWNGRRIIPARLVNDATSAKIKVSEDGDGWITYYGYQIWLHTFPEDDKVYSVIEFTGNGGQKILIDKEKDLLVVITAGNYDRKDMKNSSFDILFDMVYPSIRN